MGFGGPAGFSVERRRIYDNLWPSSPRTGGLDAALPAIAFTSCVAGAAWDWWIVTGFDDDASLEILRGLQPNVARAGALVPLAPVPLPRRAERGPDPLSNVRSKGVSGPP